MKCKLCGSERTRKAGKRATRHGIFQQYLCKDCGHIMKGELLKPPAIPKGVET